MKAVNRLQLVPENAKLFDNIEAQALMKTDVEEAGEVLLVTKTVDEDGNVDVLLVFPTEQADADGEPTGTYLPTGLRMTLNTFLNTARMVAIHHQAVIGDPPDEYTSDDAGKILVPGGVGHG